MIHSIPRETIVETLLNSLEAERYVRGPLLLNVIDELSSSDGFTRATDFARRMFESYERGVVDDQEFVARVRELRGLVRGLSRSSSRLDETLARAKPRMSGSDPAPGLLGVA